MKWLLELIKRLFTKPMIVPEVPLETPPEEPIVPVEKSNREKLYQVAYDSLGLDMAPLNDQFGCAEALSHILMKAKVPDIHKAFVSTGELDRWLHDHLQKVESPEPGDVIMNPTGQGNGKVRGHCGIVGKYQIMSNNSQSGKWDFHWTMENWTKYYQVYGDINNRYYRWV